MTRTYTTTDGRTMKYEICPTCWGRGKRDCERCKGEGYVWVEQPREDGDE